MHAYLMGLDSGLVDTLQIVTVFAGVLFVLDAFTVRCFAASEIPCKLLHDPGAVHVVNVKVPQILHACSTAREGKKQCYSVVSSERSLVSTAKRTTKQGSTALRAILPMCGQESFAFLPFRGRWLHL